MKQILCVLVLAAVTPFAAAAQLSSTDPETPRITVTGEALVNVTPDKVSILLGIETWDKEMQEAKRQNNVILGKTKEALKKIGIEEKEIRTDHLSIEPRYKNDYRKENFIGYFVRNSIAVNLLEPSKIEELITSVLTSGVTHIHGINFETTEFKKHRETARRLALEAAREKGKKMADVLDRKIGDPIQISEVKQYRPWTYYGGWWGYGRGQAMTQNVMQNTGGQASDLHETVALGKLAVRANVTVVFELK